MLATVAILAVGLATLAVALLETVVGVPNASAAYLVAVVVTAVVAGTLGAMLTVLASFVPADLG